MQIDLPSLEKARRLYEANVAPRARALRTLEQYALGTQYEGRPSFWDDEVPLRDRSPCIVVPIGERAAQSNVDLCLGQGRAPTFSFYASEDDSVFDAALGLTEDDAALLTRFLCACVEQSDAGTAFQDALLWAQLHGTTVGIVCARGGKLAVDIEDAKWCSPTFAEDDPDAVTALEIRYPFLREDVGEGGKLYSRCMLYRRVIDETRDVVYAPAEANENAADPERWVEERAVEHGFGFCPVRWYRHGTTGRARGLDGKAIHALVLDEIHQFNLALSQVHRAAITSTDPQMYETGVDADHNPAPMGRTASLWMPGDPAANRAWITQQGPSGRDGRPARKRGPGVVLRYPDAQSRVGLLTLPGDALTASSNNARSLYAFLKETLGVVFLDPEQTKVGSDISGRALEWLHSKQIDRCNMMRPRFARGFMLPVLSMMLRVALLAKGTIFLPGADKARAVLQRFQRQLSGATAATWFDPDIRVTWGPYFAPTAADAKADVESAITAKDAGIITQHTAVEKIRPHFPDIRDVQQYLEALETERAGKMQAFHDAAAALTERAEERTAEPPEAEEDAPASVRRPKVVPPKPEPRAPKGKKPPVVRAKKRPRPAEEEAAA